MLVKEYRVCMPLTVEEYKIGQLYMIAKHSFEETTNGDGEGIEFVVNEPINDPERGQGQYTEKRAYLNSKLGPWLGPMVPKVFFVTEKSWNFYPYTRTEYQCSFIPRFNIRVETVYRDDNGREPNALKLGRDVLAVREVDVIDIADDKQMSHSKLASLPDLRTFTSTKTGRGCLGQDWMKTCKPIMCSYKLVEVAFDVWGIGSTIETHVQQGIRELLAVGHREAFAWIDSWHGMTEEDVRKYEDEMRTHMYGTPMIDRQNAKISKTAKRVAEAEAKGEVQPIQAPAGGGVLRRMSSGAGNLFGSLSGSFTHLMGGQKDKT